VITSHENIFLAVILTDNEIKMLNYTPKCYQMVKMILHLTTCLQ